VQFSITTLLAVTLAVGVVCGVFFALPDSMTVAGIHLMYALSLPISIAGLVYGKRVVRAFFIGCLVFVSPVAVMFLSEVYDAVTFGPGDFLFNDSSPEEIVAARTAYILLYVCAMLFGVSSAAVYWWLRPRGDPPRRVAMRDAEESAGPVRGVGAIPSPAVSAKMATADRNCRA